jgi:hypothetical protein
MSPVIAARLSPADEQAVQIRLQAKDLLAATLRGRSQPRVNPALAEAARQAVDLCCSLIAPAAVSADLEVLAVKGEQVILCTGEGTEAVLTVGPKADLLAPAQRFVAAACTIGPALEARVRELEQEQEPLLAYMLDSAGVMALGAVSEALRCRVEEQAHVLGWGVSPAVSPGSLVGWPLQGQRDLCALLPLASIGMRLSNVCVLEPHKSTSMGIGLGAGFPAHQVGSVCQYCNLADHCWRRRDDALADEGVSC